MTTTSLFQSVLNPTPRSLILLPLRLRVLCHVSPVNIETGGWCIDMLKTQPVFTRVHNGGNSRIIGCHKSRSCGSQRETHRKTKLHNSQTSVHSTLYSFEALMKSKMLVKQQHVRMQREPRGRERSRALNLHRDRVAHTVCGFFCRSAQRPIVQGGKGT